MFKILFQVTDTAFLGHLSETVLGAVAIATIFYFAIVMLVCGFGLGIQIVIAWRVGEHELAISNIIRSIYVLLMVLVFGSAVNTLMSQVIGEGFPEKVMLIIWRTTQLSFLSVFALVGLSIFIPDFIISIYTDNALLIEHTCSVVCCFWFSTFISYCHYFISWYFGDRTNFACHASRNCSLHFIFSGGFSLDSSL